jgi:hypothetical protein
LTVHCCATRFLPICIRHGEETENSQEVGRLEAQAVRLARCPDRPRRSAEPRGNERPFSIFTETSAVEPYYWLTDAGVDIESNANAGLLRLVEAAPGRPNPDGTHPASVAEGDRTLVALANALENSEPPSSPSQMVIDHARTTLLQGCESLARRKAELHAEPNVVRSLVNLVEPYLDVDPTAVAPAESQTRLRAAAVKVALLLCSANEETATRLTPKIEPLLTDEAEEVRAAIAEDMGQLWDVARPVLQCQFNEAREQRRIFAMGVRRQGKR